MKAGFAGFGIWTRGIHSVDAFAAGCANDYANGYAALSAQEFVNPKPQAVPPKERRRAGLMINLAVEVAHQACEHAGADKTQIPSVFVSALGDTAITDYMCRKLAQPEKLLSPTKFHNSVHNAPSGYWTISAENRAPSSFVGGFRDSFGAGLFEAVSQAHAFDRPVLLVAYDIANSAPFADIEPVAETLGIGLVVTNGQFQNNAASNSTVVRTCDVDFEAVEGPMDCEQSQPRSQALRELARLNPVGGGLALLEQLVAPVDNKELRIKAAPEAVLRLSF